MKIGKADNSNANKKINKEVVLKAHTKHISKINNNEVCKRVLIAEYHEVNNAIIRISILNKRNGKFKLCCNSNQEFAG